MSIIEILNSQQFMRKHSQLMYDAIFLKDLTPSERGAYIRGLYESLKQLSQYDDLTVDEYKSFVKGLEDTQKLLNEFIVLSEQNS